MDYCKKINTGRWNMDGTITLSQIEIMPYQLIHLHELKVVKTANDHARLILPGRLMKTYATIT